MAFIAVRSRYVEDRLFASGCEQYVILGAGLDSFAWRRPDVLHRIRVFEVDHPSTQARKQQRVEALALPSHPHHRFVPVDFETQTLADELVAAGFDCEQPAVFSWLGVSEYLSVGAIEGLLRTVAGCAARSEIGLTYAPPMTSLDDAGREFRAIVTRLAADAGEPFQTLLEPDDAEALLRRCGLRVADHPTHDYLTARYFAGRPDHLTPYTAERIITGAVD
jgi:methyltransferase (TIGR00027 family)